MIARYLEKAKAIFFVCCLIEMLAGQRLNAQVFGPQEIKWLWVGSLRQYFSSASQEVEYGRRGRGVYLNTDQNDGLRWPAQYLYQDHNVGKALWIGTTNFTDPSNGITYPFKVIPLGRSSMYVNSAVFPVEFRLIGQADRPTVLVDGADATDLSGNDLNLTGGEDRVDPTIPADRIILNRVNTPVGITITRKVLAFTQQYHDNYYIYEYVFKNTGLTDNAGGSISPPKTLTGVVFDFRYRFSNNNEGYELGWGFAQISWGKNTINDCIGQDPAHSLASPNDFRATISYYGPHSASSGVQDDIGAPAFQDGHILGGSSFCGELVLHADKSPQDQSDDPSQPFTTQFMGSDGPIENISPSSPFNSTVMTQQYQSMTAGHPAQTHAEQLGKDANGWPSNFANTWGGNTGGYSCQQAFGPYTLAPGDSVRIVIAEAIAGIDRRTNEQIARNWYTWYNNGRSGTTQLQLPAGPPWNGSTTTDGNLYKNAWVFTGRDSLLQTFRRARANFQSGYAIPKPPPAPDRFTVTSGGNMITLQWSASAESAPHFNGYRIYRAETKSDTTFDLIASFDRSSLPAMVSGFRTYYDKSPKRGFNYYYYIQTKDDGSTNDIEAGVPLVSSKFYTMTNVAAYLTRPPGGIAGTPDQYSLSSIRIVPNPYNISARGIQFGTDVSTMNQISFFGLPPFCTIRIFTETGDLVQTIYHTNGSGDERWNSLTSSGQIVVSGLYIAYFEVTQDYTDPVSSKVVYRKGQSIYKKLIIIR